MRQLNLCLSFIILLIFSTNSAYAHQQAEFEIKLISPIEGAAVQGLVQILGTTETDDFLDYEISFSIMTENTPNWFQIIKSEVPVDESTLAEWNTSTITDGSYSLKLTVSLQDRDSIIKIINNIRVRNYSAIETSTPSPTMTNNPRELSTATSSPMPPTATSIPANPAQINKMDINAALIWGIGGTLMLLALLGFYSSFTKR